LRQNSTVIATVPGARIWYEDSGGEGVPVVCLHAGTGNCRMWQAQQGAFPAAGYRFIAYDRRGYGRTESDATGPHAASAADDLQLIANSIGLDEFHLLGTAAGGIVALDYALTFPDRLRSLVVANSIGGVQDPDYLALQKRLRPTPAFDALPADIRELGPVYRASNPEGTQRWNDLEHGSRQAGTASLPKTRNRITFELLETLKVPTLLVTGDADLYTPAPVLQLFKRRIPRSESVVIANCGHSALWEQPQLFNNAVLEFLRGK